MSLVDWSLAEARIRGQGPEDKFEMNTLKFYYLFYQLFDMTVPKYVDSKLYTERIKPELNSLAFLGKTMFVTDIFGSYLYQTDMEIIKKIS